MSEELHEVLHVLDGVYFVLCCKKPNFLQLDDEIYELLGNWWCSGIEPSSLEMCKISATSTYSSVTITYKPTLSNSGIMEKRGKLKRPCTWEVAISAIGSMSDGSKYYHFATKEGFSQIMPLVTRDLVDFGKEVKHKRQEFECYY
mmetsp:Transcript_18720/g.31221  ORF Transcript_18720/g.31221 Transcript_18720/m.31221 type:complete len:145 (-) Transcript_18720:1371-1805(-)